MSKKTVCCFACFENLENGSKHDASYEVGCILREHTNTSSLNGQQRTPISAVQLVAGPVNTNRRNLVKPLLNEGIRWHLKGKTTDSSQRKLIFL
jgi:hypothetical protein